MRSFREYFEDEDFDARFKFGITLEKELVDELNKQLKNSDKKLQVVVPSISHQKKWLANNLKKVTGKEVSIENAMAEYDKLDKYKKSKINGLFGAEFGDIIIDRNSKPDSNYEHAALKIDAKKDGKISMRSLSRFSEISKGKSFYIVQADGGYYFINFTKELLFKLIKLFNDANSERVGKIVDADFFTIAKNHESIKTELTGGFERMRSKEIGVTIEKIKEIIKKDDIKKFKSKESISKYIIWILLK